MDIIKLATDTVLEGKYDILFNLVLVREKARPATLVESANYPDIVPSVLFRTLRDTYPEFTYTVENKIGDTPHRVLVSLTDLVGYDTEIGLAIILGFQCHGIPSPDSIRWSNSYYLLIGGKNINFYAEVCPEVYDTRSQKKLFSRIAKSIWGGAMVVNTWEELLPDTIWLDEVIRFGAREGDPAWLLHHDIELKEFMEGSGIGFLDDIDMETLLHTQYNLLLFVLVLIENDPFRVYYPLTVENGQLLETELQSHLFDKETGEVHTNLVVNYLKYLQTDSIKEIYSGDPERLAIFRESIRDVIHVYDHLTRH